MEGTEGKFDMAQMILFNIPFGIFLVYAMRVCRDRQKAAKQPATLALYLFGALLAQWILTLLLHVLLRGSESGRHFLVSSSPFFVAFHACLMAGLFACALAWRQPPEGEYRRPVILVGSVLALKGIGMGVTAWLQELAFSGNPSRTDMMMTALGLITTVINFASYVIVLKAIFGWRGDSEVALWPLQRVPTLAPVSMPTPSLASATSASQAPQQAAPAQGMFKEEDFIPYICGVMGLGGFLVVPILWSGFTHLNYGQAIFPSLLSCGIFAFSHDKEGRFNWGRYLGLMAVVLISMLRASLRYNNNGRPMFFAGGVLGYLVMLGCGWAGIAIARSLRTPQERS